MESNTDIQNRYAKTIWDAWDHADSAWCCVHNLANETAAYIADDVNDYNEIVCHFNWIEDKLESVTDLDLDSDLYDLVDNLCAAASLAGMAVELIDWIQSAAHLVWPRVDDPKARAARAARAVRCMAMAESLMWTDLDYDYGSDIWTDSKNHAILLCRNYYEVETQRMELLWGAIEDAAASAAMLDESEEIKAVANAITDDYGWAADIWANLEYLEWIHCPESYEPRDLIPL